MISIIIAVACVGGLGLLFGLILGIASKVFEVQTDERISQIVNALPCANCGACGFAGCGAFAEAVVRGIAPTSACTVGGKKTADEVSKIMGVTSSFTRYVATVGCCNSNCVDKPKYEYTGIKSCDACSQLLGGTKKCAYACLGIGSCVDVCQYDAISIVDGIAVVAQDKCTDCKKCISACPRHLIFSKPFEKRYFVRCSSHDSGVEMKGICSVGCIACKICEKNCPSGAIVVTDNLAKIDYSKCTDCGICFEKCPTKVINEVK